MVDTNFAETSLVGFGTVIFGGILGRRGHETSVERRSGSM